MVLQDCKSSLGLELFVIESHKIGLGLFDFEIHLFCQFLHIFDCLEFGLVDALHAIFLFLD